MTETIDTTESVDDLLDAEPSADELAESEAAMGESDTDELAVPANSLAAQQISSTLGTHRGHPVLPFDFRRPYNISKAFETNMLTICESFAKAASLSFTSMLRSNVTIDHDSLQLTTFGDYLRSLSDLSCVGTMSMPPLAGQSLILLDIGMSFTLMKRLLGGQIETETDMRKFTDVEFGVATILVTKFLDAMQNSFEKTIPIETTLHGLENNPTYLGTMSNSETVILLKFKIDIDAIEGDVVLCMPLTAFEPVWNLFSPEEGAEYRSSSEIKRDRISVFDMLQITAADVVVNLGNLSMPMAQVLQIKEGDVIPMEKSVNSKLTVEIQGIPMFEGSPGKLNNKRALKITNSLDWED
jgi:flagellar motor switch protein FliM